MTFGDVIDLVLQLETPQARQEAILLIGELSEKHKPGFGFMPISPVERGQILEDLQRRAATIRAVQAAMGDARARHPAHFRVVHRGER